MKAKPISDAQRPEAAGTGWRRPPNARRIRRGSPLVEQLHALARDVFYGRRGRSSKYLNNLIKQDHRRIKQRIRPMLGFKRFETAAVTIRGIVLAEKIKKHQFNLQPLTGKETTAPETWGGGAGLMKSTKPLAGQKHTAVESRRV